MKFSIFNKHCQLFDGHFEIGELQNEVHCVYLGEIFSSIFSNEYWVAKIGFDTVENEPCEVCPLSVHRSPR